jgi:hypothetical protein
MFILAVITSIANEWYEGTSTTEAPAGPKSIFFEFLFSAFLFLSHQSPVQKAIQSVQKSKKKELYDCTTVRLHDSRNQERNLLYFPGFPGNWDENL